MLHGWTQNGLVLSEKSSNFKRKFRNVASLHFLSGPHHVPKCEGVTDREDARGWWNYDTATFASADDPGRFRREYTGWPLSRDLIAKAWQEHGPFDGICGFSQGAVVLHQLLRELGNADAMDKEITEILLPIVKSPPKFGIFVCGFPAQHGGSAGLPPASLIKLPSIHVIAENDSVVPAALQRELAALFPGAERLVTDKGHAMPQRAAELSSIVDFVTKTATLSGTVVR